MIHSQLKSFIIRSSIVKQWPWHHDNVVHICISNSAAATKTFFLAFAALSRLLVSRARASGKGDGDVWRPKRSAEGKWPSPLCLLRPRDRLKSGSPPPYRQYTNAQSHSASHRYIHLLSYRKSFKIKEWSRRKYCISRARRARVSFSFLHSHFLIRLRSNVTLYPSQS